MLINYIDQENKHYEQMQKETLYFAEHSTPTQPAPWVTRSQARQAVLEVTAVALRLPMPASYSAWFN